MKFTAAGLVALVVLSQRDVADAFTTTSTSRLGGAGLQQLSSSTTTSLKVTTLDQWQLLDNGSVVGSVRGHPVLNDGDIITTSPLAAPNAAQPSNEVTTLTGSKYKLGNPMINRSGSVGVANSGQQPGGVGRSTFVQVAGTASLFAGGVALGAQLGGFGKPEMTIPEVRLGCQTLETVDVLLLLCSTVSFLEHFVFVKTTHCNLTSYIPGTKLQVQFLYPTGISFRTPLVVDQRWLFGSSDMQIFRYHVLIQPFSFHLSLR